LAYLSQTDSVDNPTYLCVSPDSKFIYAVSENPRNGTVSAFNFDKVNGKITFINKQKVGNAPVHVMIDKEQKNVFVSSYQSGNLTVLPVNKDGSLGAPSQIIQNQGSSINKPRQTSPHVHSTIISPDNKYLFEADLGTDKINIYRYKSSKAQPLTPEEPAFVSVKPGNGPRHMAFSADGKFLYLVQELGGEVTVFSVNGSKLNAIQTLTLAAPDFKGEISGADIQIAPNGKMLYTSNRGDANEITSYIINPADGKLTLQERTSAMGKTPRGFIIDPNGKFAIIANQGTNSVNVLAIDQATGRLYPSRSRITDISMPVCVKLVAVE
jgi:6-phosphogluconolactonase